MFEPALEAISQLQYEASTYPLGVQNWMKLMAISFLISIPFAYSKSGARWILAAFIINIFRLDRRQDTISRVDASRDWYLRPFVGLDNNIVDDLETEQPTSIYVARHRNFQWRLSSLAHLGE